MSATADRTMPVMDAYPVLPLRDGMSLAERLERMSDEPFAGHWRAVFPGEVRERTYPDAESLRHAALRIGAAVRFHSASGNPGRSCPWQP